MSARARDRVGVGGSKWGWRCAALLLGGVVLGLGCGPANLAYLMLPFDPGTPPECPLTSADKKKESKVVVLVSYAGTPDITPELLNADQELSERFVFLLRKQLEKNKDKVKLVPPHLVKAYQNKEDWKTQSPAEIGKHFQADKVVCLEISSMSLFEKNSRMIFKGNVDINITVTDMGKDGEEPAEVFRKQYLCEYPHVKVIPADSGGGTPYFRGVFINRVCKDLVDIFTQHESPVGNHPVDDE